MFGQLILNIYVSLGVPQQEAGNPTVATVIFIAASLTAAGVFDNVAQLAGAGIAVPVTGFANSVTSMAMEFRREGLVTEQGQDVRPGRLDHRFRRGDRFCCGVDIGINLRKPARGAGIANSYS